MKKNKMQHKFEASLSNKKPRSKFPRNHEHKTSMNAGEIIPIYIDDVLPGDTFKMNTKAIIRQSTLIKPVMDNSYVDIMYYFVPNRLLWQDWEKFWGYNEDEWAENTPLTTPKINSPDKGWEIGTLADYFGIVPNKKLTNIEAMPFRAYAKIYNDWFRDQNNQKATHITLTTTTTTGSNGNDITTDLEKGGKPAIAGKYHDYFTSALPSQQKGKPIEIPMGGMAEVHAMSKTFETTNQDTNITFKMPDAQASRNYQATLTTSVAGKQGTLTYKNADTSSPSVTQAIPNNLYANLKNATAVTINELRSAITLQQMLELDARGGTRYTEYVQAHFGVHSADARQQRSEYLGGLHQPISINTALQTSSTDATSPQGNLAGYGVTGISKNSFNKSFTEHGYIIGVAIIRYNHTYQQGIEPLWRRGTKYKFYDPIFAHISEQPILNEEIFAQGTDQDKETFGFKEPWAEYRYKPNRTSGKMRGGLPKDGSLATWHYGDIYTSLPKLSPTWIIEDKNNVDRTLQIKSSGENAEPQYIADFYFELECTRPMPTYSIPGLQRI